MDLIGGALPNVMFIVGIIALGISLGIEFKVIEIKAQLGKAGRIASFCIGMGLIGTSIFLYTRPTPAPATSQATVSDAMAISGEAPTVPPPEATLPPPTTPPPPSPTAEATLPVPATAPAVPVLSVDDAFAQATAQVDQAVDDGALDSGIAGKLRELLSRLEGQIAQNKSKEADKTREELVYNIDDAVEDGKFEAGAARELRKLVRSIPIE